MAGDAEQPRTSRRFDRPETVSGQKSLSESLGGQVSGDLGVGGAPIEPSQYLMDVPVVHDTEAVSPPIPQQLSVRTQTAYISLRHLI
jgi:hypothetical protein